MDLGGCNRADDIFPSEAYLKWHQDRLLCQLLPNEAVLYMVICFALHCWYSIVTNYLFSHHYFPNSSEKFDAYILSARM